MNEDLNQKVRQLEQQIQELLSWKRQRQGQQLSYPLDSISKDVIGSEFLRAVNEITYTRPSGREIPLYVVARAKGKDYFLTSSPTLFTFTAATSDVITINTNITIENNLQFILFSSQTLPAGLVSDTIYYSINSSGNTCKLSLTSGGGAVNITDTGLGLHYLYFA